MSGFFVKPSDYPASERFRLKFGQHLEKEGIIWAKAWSSLQQIRKYVVVDRLPPRLGL